MFDFKIAVALTVAAGIGFTTLVAFGFALKAVIGWVFG